MTEIRFQVQTAHIRSLLSQLPPLSVSFQLNVDFSFVSHFNSASFQSISAFFHALGSPYSPSAASVPPFTANIKFGHLLKSGSSHQNVDFTSVSACNPASSRFFFWEKGHSGGAFAWPTHEPVSLPLGHLALAQANRSFSSSAAPLTPPPFTPVDSHPQQPVTSGKSFVNFTLPELQPKKTFRDSFSFHPSLLHFTPKKTKKISLTQPLDFCTIAPNPNVD
jgi:hypothetical protein